MMAAIQKSVLLTGALLFCSNLIYGQVELGKVTWLRDLDQGVEQARAEGKPIFLLFQEVPGCATCQRYGQEALSHPLLVEAIETYFVPVAIYNNRQGKDAETLRYFNEPAWNNPVVRLIDAGRKDIIPRISGDYTPLGLLESMLRAIDLQNLAEPAYLHLLREEWTAQRRGTEKATFAMYCFWTGEGRFGAMDGVVATEPGFMDGREVVTLEYNPAVISFEKLLTEGQKAQCAGLVYAHDGEQRKKAVKHLPENKVMDRKTFRPDSEPKYYLSHTPYAKVPMTELQAGRANALIGQGKSPEPVLSPRQIKLAEKIKAAGGGRWSSMIGKDMAENWWRLAGK